MAQAREVRGYFPVSVLLPAEKYEALKRLVAEGRYKTVSEAVRAAVDEFLERERGEKGRRRKGEEK